MSLNLFSKKTADTSIGGKEEVFGYKNDQGKVVIEPKYDNATEFYDGFALVNFNGNIYLLNEKGIEKHIISIYSYGGLKPFYYGFGLIQGGQYQSYKWAIVDKNGNKVTDFLFQYSSDAKISNLQTLIKFVERDGASTLVWADPELLVYSDIVVMLKLALKNHLKNKANEYISNKKTKEEFKAFVLDEYETFESICQKKKSLVVKENISKGQLYNIVDEIVK